VIVPAVAIVLGLLVPSLLWNMRQPPSPVAVQPARAVEAAAGIEAAPSTGASGPTVDLVPPVVVQTEPASGARDVAAGARELQVRFSEPMTDQSWSWSEAWPGSVPELIGEPQYDAERRTCTVKVKLEAGRTYACWLNSEQFTNFKDTNGNPAVPYLLIFETRPAAEAP
jgi:Bacterial Ig-like domain